MINLPVVDQVIDISGKRVFVRGDIDVPLTQSENGKMKDEKELSTFNSQFSISDDTRLEEIWLTIDFLLSKNCQVILAGSLGRPEGKVVTELSAQPVAEWFLNKINKGNEINKVKMGEFDAFVVNDNIAVLENLRFDPREEANDEGFAKELAGLTDIYVNEAFAVSEREHASIVGVPRFLPHFAGLRLAKEIAVLSEILENPKRPLLVIIGGAKLETKIPVISKMARVADEVIVGGKLLTQVTIGSNLMNDPKVKFLRLTENEKDVTLSSIDNLQASINEAQTIVWNGPVGQVEEYNYQVGTRRIAELVAASSAKKIVGGGNTVGFLNKLGLIDKFDWVSSGGGSMLKFLAGERLPGIEALIN